MGSTMKNFAVLCSLILLLFLINCSQNEPTSPNTSDQKSGKLFLKIDKENAPDNVVWVEAFLTRQGYDTISNALNILSDSTADILLDDIQAGEWHLKIDASDSSNVILYTGETDIMIFAGFTTQVNLVLEPTGQGTGNVYIWVTWGSTPPGNWIDFSGNPVFSPSGSYWNFSGVQQPKILSENSTFKMFYTSQGNAYSGYIGLAESFDGITWTNNPTYPILEPGSTGSWDATAVAGATIIKDENGYKIYYAGWSNPDGPWHIGLATSLDGVNWNKHPNPVLYASSGWEYQLGPSSILKVNGTYYLYYYGRNLPYLSIGLATSPDGINWTRHPSNPILIADKPWEGTGVYYANVYEKNGQYEMIYMNQPATGFGKATSPDGINWTKDTANPFFTKEQTHNNWAGNKIAYPFYVRINNKDRIYYTGFPNSGPYKIGFVTR
jgi:predicted GH43/DUF377 family glycosyl hydrolase